MELSAIASTVKLVLQSVFDWRAKPFLKIEFDPAEDLGEWHLDGIRQQKVGTVHVRNILPSDVLPFCDFSPFRRGSASRRRNLHCIGQTQITLRIVTLRNVLKLVLSVGGLTSFSPSIRW